MDVHEVVEKLIGNVIPVGETNEDDRRYENLKNLTELIDRLIGDLYRVSANRNSAKFSVSRAGKHADGFLRDLGEALEEREE